MVGISFLMYRRLFLTLPKSPKCDCAKNVYIGQLINLQQSIFSNSRGKSNGYLICHGEHRCERSAI